MSGLTRPAGAEDVVRLWPAVRASKLMRSVEDLARFRAAGPWRVRVTDAGEAMVLSTWRAHLHVLAIRGLWAAPHRIGPLLDDAAVVARAQGYTDLLSPLVPVSEATPYREAGMEPVEGIVALQGDAAEVAATHVRSHAHIRIAVPADLEALVGLDAECFDEFWRYGVPEVEESLSRERVTVAEADGRLAGYCACSLHGTSLTVARLAVSSDSRRRGLGVLLLADAASYALRSRADTMTLCTQESNEASRALYRTCSLAELPARYTLAVRGA